jgi:endonuclease-3 related protein
MCVGAILTQQTAWTNVEAAIRRLKADAALDLKTIYQMESTRLEACIRPSGFYRVKARRLKNFTRLVCEEYHGRLEDLLSLPEETLRRELLSVNGVGKETADCILLYAAGVPRFVVDAYTRRMLVRHGWLTEKAGYEDAARLFQQSLDADVTVFQEYHALLVQLGKVHCKMKPQCRDCPLAAWL